MTTKEELFGQISGKYGIPEAEIKEEYNRIFEIKKKEFKTLTPEQQESKAIKSFIIYYKNLEKLGGKKHIGYVLGFDTANDRNKYKMNLKPTNREDEEAMEKKFGVKFVNGKVHGIKKDGGTFELQTKNQRNVYGICKSDTGIFVPFSLFWSVEDVENAPLPILHKAVEFRGIPTVKDDGSLNIQSVPETRFIESKEKLEPLEDLLKKSVFGKPSKIEDLSKTPEKSRVVLRTELYGRIPSPNYGDRFCVPLGEMTLDSEDITIQMEADFDISNVEGWAEGVPCIVFGTYKPYTNKEGKLVRKVVCFGIYVFGKDRVKQEVQESITTEVAKDMTEKWD